jgi:hypothetical protein
VREWLEAHSATDRGMQGRDAQETPTLSS